MSKDISSSAWLGDVPADWRRTRIKRVTRLSPSYSNGKPSGQSLCTVVPMESVSVLGELNADTQMEFSAVTSGLNLFENGDVLFAKITPCMENGKGALVSNLTTTYAFGSTEFHVLRPRHEVSGKFLYYYTFNPTFRAWAEKNMRGAAGQQRVSAKFLKYTHLPLPSINAQERIAAYLDACCAAIDEAIAVKRQQIGTTDTLRKSIISSTVLRGLKERVKCEPTGNQWLADLPVGWKLVALKRIATIQTGLTLGKAYEPPVVERPYLRTANVQDGYLDLEKITTIEIPPHLPERYELQCGDVLMTEGGDLDKLGRGFLWEGQIPGCLHQNHVFALRCFPHKLLPKFLTYLTTSSYGRDYFEATGKRTTNLASTNSTKVGQFPVPLPPVPEQEEIVEYLDKRLKQVNAVEQCISKQVETLSAYRKSLIHECVTGKRRITADDLAKVGAHV